MEKQKYASYYERFSASCPGLKTFWNFIPIISQKKCLTFKRIPLHLSDFYRFTLRNSAKTQTFPFPFAFLAAWRDTNKNIFHFETLKFPLTQRRNFCLSTFAIYLLLFL